MEGPGTLSYNVLKKLVTSNYLFFRFLTRGSEIPKDRYTVFASLNRLSDLKLLALATGTQACLRKYADDIQDCHAESLLKRAFKRHLVEQLGPGDDKRLAGTTLDLLLFISQFPCGLINRYQGDQPLTEDGLPIKRKPGRGLVMDDGSVAYVLKPPCFDKLIKWVKDGLQGEKLKRLFKIKANIKIILIGGCESSCPENYESAYSKLKESLFSVSPRLDVRLIESFHPEEFTRSTSKEPYPVATVWWASVANAEGVTESLVDGRKRGLTFKSLQDGKYRRLKIATSVINQDLLDVASKHNLD